jgi:N-methylhydantoinase A/oxoprolinase/acetone carboxylase beta subunit
MKKTDYKIKKIDNNALGMTLSEMQALYEKNPQKAIRSQDFIKKLHNYCILELKRAGISEKKVKILREVEIYGTHKKKKVDVAVVHPTAGPLIVISVRSQMSSINKNKFNNYEMLIGDVISLHERYPSLVVGNLFLLPKKSYLNNEIPPFDEYEKLLKKISQRKDDKDRYDKYEHIALLVVDFEKRPPEVVADIPKDDALRIENFFQKLVETYKERNPFLEITTPF